MMQGTDDCEKGLLGHESEAAAPLLPNEHSNEMQTVPLDPEPPQHQEAPLCRCQLWAQTEEAQSLQRFVKYTTYASCVVFVLICLTTAAIMAYLLYLKIREQTKDIQGISRQLDNQEDLLRQIQRLKPQL